LLRTKTGKHCAIDALRAEHIYIEGTHDLLRSKGFRRADDQVPGVVHHGIEAIVFLIDCFNGAVGRFLRLDVKFERAKIGFVRGGKGL
jgi:hypothetical protein